MTRPAPTEPGCDATATPIGSWVYRVPAVRPRTARAVAGLVAAGGIALLTVAALVTPDASGVGSHRQLGLAPCVSLTLFGYPCPTCGMTTAFAHTVRGEWLTAFHTQPAGFLLALSVAVAVGLSLSVVVTSKVWAVNWTRVSPTVVALSLLGVVVGAWVYKLAVGITTGALPVGR